MTTINELIDAEPAATDGVPIESIDGQAGWRAVTQIADPAEAADVVWHDVSPYLIGYSLRLGATEYAGRFRATVCDIELMAEGSTLAPWNPDTSATFGVHVPLGAGLLIRFGLIRVSGGSVVEWLPRFTLKVESWRDCGYARGQIRRHPIVARDTLTSLVNVPVPAQLEEDWSDRVVNINTAANWPYGLLAYHDNALTVPDRDEQPSAITELDQTLDPNGLIVYTNRRGNMVIRPKIGDTLHGGAALGLGFGTFWFHYIAANDTFGLIAYPIEKDEGGVDLGDTEDAVRNHVKVNYSYPTPGVFDDEDAASILRYDRKTYQASWIVQNDQAAQDILDYRTGATKQLEPVYTEHGMSGFRHALDIEYLNPGTVTHRHSASEAVIDAIGHARYLEEQFRPLGGELIEMSIRTTVDVNTWDVSATMLPVEDLAVTALGPTGAEFGWTNPGGQPITPTHTQVRLFPLTSVWATYAYPITTFDWGGLDPETSYQFQVRLAAFTDGILTDASPARTVAFTTTAAEVPDGDGNLPEPPDGCSSVQWRLEESTDPATWADPDVPEWNTGSPIDTGTITSPPWTVDLSGYTFDPTKLYRLGSNACGAGWVWSFPFVGECTDPTALGGAPFDDADLEAYWPGLCPPDTIVEAITEEPATTGPVFEQAILDGDSNIVLVSDGEGLVAYGVAPAAVAALTEDTTIACKVIIQDQPTAPVVLFGAAGMWIEAVADGSGWAVRGKAHEDGAGITTISGPTELAFGTWYDLALVHDETAETLVLYIDGIEEVDAATVAVRHNPGLFEIGGPDDTLITNCAVWSRVLLDTELPGYNVTPLTIAGYGTNSASSGFNLTSPTTGRAVQAGDLCIAFLTRTLFSSGVYTAPTGWTLIDSHRTGSNNPTMMYARVCDGTETSVSFGTSSAGNRWLWFLVAGASGYEDPQTTGAGSATTTATPAGVTASNPNSLMVQMFTANSNDTPSHTGASWSTYAEASSSFMHGLLTYTGVGASPSLQWSKTGSGINWGTGGVVIMP